MKDEFRKERRKFERWVLAQFPGFDVTLLKRNFKHEYTSEIINAMFIGFCGGWHLRK